MSNETLIEAIVSSADQANQLSVQAQKMVVTTYRLLADAESVSLERFADAFELSAEQAEQMIAMVPPGALDRDDEGSLTAFAGLTLKETDHRMEIDGKTLHCWCAFDTLFISALLGKNAQVASKDPVSGETIRFTFGPSGYEGPDGIAMSLVETKPAQLRANVRAAFCHNVFFFSSADSASRYVVDNPGIVTIPMSDAITLAARWNERIYGEALAQ